ncbi:hypothetical protein [Helicovermis profundi]|uniref:Uncharacterized protein n=1 Tax=Helicovermis profundi TaxID=3065157 RepID=A0AAU9E0N6_9FIRM|nr:hypothetical protein HLPR_01670 [Clostridia bacterium S502]
MYEEKWRETIIDPNAIELPDFIQVKEVLGYPYAANDVFNIRCIVDGIGKDCVLKY